MKYYPDDIAAVLCKLAGNDDPDDKGVFRLTYFWNGKKPNGKTYIMDPTMHENYKGKEDTYRGHDISLLDILSGFCHKEDLTIEIA